jgi:hypothetical protein
MATYRIHPGIGVARLGNSDTAFYIAPETPAALPFACDAAGNQILSSDGVTPVLVSSFKDSEGRVKRQAARFQVFVHEDDSPEGRPLKLGDPVEGGSNHGKLVDVQWRVYLANKKASWYQFDALTGEHGHGDDSPRRNPDVTGQARDRLIIDPGPRIVDTTTNRRGSFDRSGNGQYATTFPPPLDPFSIDTLGDILTDDAGRLLVLGGHGHSGTEKTGPGEPHIETYANTDGWYDDTSDGPVMARLIMYSEQVGQTRFVDVEYPAWVIVGYPRFVPQILDMITMDEVTHDMFLREFATDTALYGKIGTFDDPERVDSRDPDALRHWKAGRLTWNKDYKPWFYRDIWPILFRPDEFRFLTDILEQSNFPHDQEQRGTFDPYKLGKTSRPPVESPSDTGTTAAQSPIQSEALTEVHSPEVRLAGDEGKGPDFQYWAMRNFLFDLLRRGGEENQFKYADKVGGRLHNLPLMPLLCGDNPITNVIPSKFLRLTDYQLFILRQWADGNFINEIQEGWLDPKTFSPFLPYPSTPPSTGLGLDRGVLTNVLGGAFCPGGEVGWVMRDPSIYLEPYRITADRSLSDFLQSAAQASATHATVRQDYTFSMDAPLSQDNDYATGLQPGDLTKSMGLPWQSDFNECTTQPINITYAEWNQISPRNNQDKRLEDEEKVWTTLWWPAHRPLQSFELVSVENGKATTNWTVWSSGIPQTYAGDLKMVTEWSKLGFVIRNPYVPAEQLLQPSDGNTAKYISIERS